MAKVSLISNRSTSKRWFKNSSKQASGCTSLWTLPIYFVSYIFTLWLGVFHCICSSSLKLKDIHLASFHLVVIHLWKLRPIHQQILFFSSPIALPAFLFWEWSPPSHPIYLQMLLEHSKDYKYIRQNRQNLCLSSSWKNPRDHERCSSDTSS